MRNAPTLEEIHEDYLTYLSWIQLRYGHADTTAALEYLLCEMRAGHIDGNDYDPGENEECGCIIGTVAQHLATNYGDMTYDCQDDGYRDTYLASFERYLMPVRPGDTPGNHEILANFARWTAEFVESLSAQSAPQESTHVH